MDQKARLPLPGVSPNTTTTTKEAQTSRALLVLHERLAQASAENKQKLAHAAAAFEQQLACAAAAWAAKQEALSERLVEQCRRRRQLLLLSSGILAWRCQQQMQQQRTLRRRTLTVALTAWQQAVQSIRYEAQETQAAAFSCWRTHTSQRAAAKRRFSKLRTCRLSRLLHAWLQLSTAQQEAAQQRMSWAQHWCCRRVLRRCCHSWQQQWSSKQELVEAHRQQQQEALAQRVLQEWQQWATQQVRQRRAEQQQQHTTAAQAHMQLHSTWATWRRTTAAGQQLAARHHSSRMLRACLATWLQLPATNLRLRAISAAVGSVYRLLLLCWGYRAFCSCCFDAAAARRAARQCVRAWCQVAAAGLRQRHAVRARVERRRVALLQAAVRGWAHVAWRASRTAAGVQACELKAALSASAAQCESQQAELEVLSAHQAALVKLVRACITAAVPELPLAPTLQWQCLLAAPGLGAQQQLLPRARHAAFALSALQPAQWQERVQACLQRHSSIKEPSTSRDEHLQAAAVAGGTRGQGCCDTEAGLLGCLVVFGGVAAGGDWLSDVSLLLLTDSPAGSCCVQTVPVQATACQQGCGSGRDTMGGLPLPVCDFAACEVGPAAFVVVGGFDSCGTSMQLQMCSLRRHVAARNDDAACAPGSDSVYAKRSSCGGSAGQPQAAAVCGQQPQQQQQQQQQPGADAVGWAQGWRCSWELLQPRTRSPAGRCHHSCCWHADSRSVVVFGGYASMRGCLGDVQVYSVDHREWLAPAQTGAWPSPRRSHAAVIMGGSLWVSGGLDSSGVHLADLWRCDLASWQWQQLGAQACGLVGSCGPAGRRGHCLVGVQGRFLLLHGGYSGTAELLQDAWLYDTDRDIWLPVELTAATADQPVARALHTVTHLAQRFVVVGGQTPLGPLSQVSMLCSPAVLAAQQLQEHSLEQQVQLAQAQQQGLALAAQCRGYEAQLERSKAKNQAAAHAAAAAEQLAADSFRAASSAHAAREAAESAVVAAEARAIAAADAVCTLERRLARAREGGRKALAAAQLLSDPN